MDKTKEPEKDGHSIPTAHDQSKYRNMTISFHDHFCIIPLLTISLPFSYNSFAKFRGQIEESQHDRVIFKSLLKQDVLQRNYTVLVFSHTVY